jgi:ADP-ribose pyrophosphatase
MTKIEFEETRIDGRTVFEGRILTLEVDRVRTPGGGESIREVIRHPGASVMVPVTDDGKVLFVRQFRYPTGGVLLELPAGKLDPGEDPQICAERETAEETGFRPRRVEKLGEFYTAPGFTDELIRAYLVTDLVPAPEAEADAAEVVELVSLSFSEYRDLITRGEIRDAKTLAAMALWAERGSVQER